MTFTLFFGGAETPSHRKLLVEQGVAGVCINFFNLCRRLPKRKKWLISEHFPSDMVVMVDAGAATVNKRSVLGREEVLDVYDRYKEWAEENFGRITFLTDFDVEILGEPWIEEQRERYWESWGEKALVTWRGTGRFTEFVDFARRWQRVGLNEHAVKMTPQLRAAMAQVDCQFHLWSATSEDLVALPIATASTSSWYSAGRYGETVVWDGVALRRVAASGKADARKRYRHIIEQAGFDMGLIDADNARETTRLALWSWCRLEADLVARTPESRPGDMVPLDDQGVAMTLPAAARPSGAPREIEERARDVLPVFSLAPYAIADQDEDGSPVERVSTELLPTLSSDGLRRCDTCRVATSCPAFKPRASCAFSIPVEVRSKEQLLATMRAILEMQNQRILFGKFVEELEGGYPDPNLSIEIDRFFALVAKYKDLVEDKEHLRVEIEATKTSGLISRLFGEKLGSRVVGPELVNPDALVIDVLDLG